jgi:hypothetical protein
MGLRSMLFAVGMGTLWGGCRTPSGRLPDSASATAAFSPDGREIYVLPPHRMYSWDLETKRIVRDREIKQAEAGITFSPRGAFVVLAAQDKGDRRASVSLIRARDGETVLTRELLDAPVAADAGYPLHTRDLLAATDDGRWLAVYRLDSRELEVVAVADGRTALRTPLEGYVQRLAFNARGDRLFVSTDEGEKQTARIVALSGKQWMPAATLDGAFYPAWTAKGLAYGTRRGIELWDGAQARLVVGNEPPFDLAPDVTDPRWSLSPDGSVCILWNNVAFAVRETATGALIAARDIDTGGIRAVLAAAFTPKAVRALLATGELVDVDVASRSVTRRASFGRPGRYRKNLLQDGSSWEQNYSALLSPTGRYLALFKADSGYELYLTE